MILVVKNGVFTVTSSDATFTIDSEDYDRVVFIATLGTMRALWIVFQFTSKNE